jgi:hypothetical protein
MNAGDARRGHAQRIAASAALVGFLKDWRA